MLTRQQNVAPSWGNYLYQNVLPNIPTDWIMNANLSSTNSGSNTHSNGASGQANLFTSAATGWSGATHSGPNAASAGMPISQSEPNSYYMNYYSGSIAPALIAPSTSSTGSGTPSTIHISPSIDVVDKIVTSPSPIASVGGSPPTFHTGRFRVQSFNARPNRSLYSEADGEMDHHSHHSEEHESPHEHEHDEGVERDGMIWGMKVEEYRALSARERKRVRNRISARTFRAKRKEHLNSLESTLGAKDLEIKLAHEENMRLRRELGELKRRLAQYEQKPY